MAKTNYAIVENIPAKIIELPDGGLGIQRLSPRTRKFERAMPDDLILLVIPTIALLVITHHLIRTHTYSRSLRDLGFQPSEDGKDALNQFLAATRLPRRERYRPKISQIFVTRNSPEPTNPRCSIFIVPPVARGFLKGALSLIYGAEKIDVPKQLMESGISAILAEEHRSLSRLLHENELRLLQHALAAGLFQIELGPSASIFTPAPNHWNARSELDFIRNWQAPD